MFLMYDLKMNRIEFPTGFIPLDLLVYSAERMRNTNHVEGSNMTLNYGSVFSGRELHLRALLRASNTDDYRLLRDETYAIFKQHDAFYISEEYQPGKRYLISSDSMFIPERIANNQTHAEIDVFCTTTELPFAESVLTTSTIDRHGLNYGDGWSYGMGLLYDEESHKYTHTGTSFRIYNAGNVPVHPFEQELKITISDVVGSVDYLELRNKTNGTTFRVTEKVTSSQTIVLDGPNITSNDLQYFRKTNRKFIELNKGWNEFEIKGADRATVSFDFRFYYL